MSKIVIITDTHFGVRGSSPYFIKKAEEFFKNVFFPYIDEHNIKTIIHMGDVFDKRPTLNYVVLDEASKFFFDELNKRQIRTIFIIGNHDCPYRNTNHPNSVRLLLDNDHYPTFEVYDDPSETIIYNSTVCLIPWINPENEVESKRLIDTTKAQYLFGHLEIIGFQMLKGIKSDVGFDRNFLGKFDKVFSGHFHHRSSESNIHYLGNPYETTWADYGNTKGFHTLDMETGELEFIENTFTSHIIIENVDDINDVIVGNKIVKIDITNKDEIQKNLIYKKIDALTIPMFNYSIVDNSDFKERTKNVQIEDVSIKTTKELIKEYINSSELSKKDKIENYLLNAYQKASEF